MELIGIGLILYGVACLFSGSVLFISHFGCANFSREDDGAVYYICVVGVLLAGMQLLWASL